MRQKLFTVEDRFYVNGVSGTAIVGAFQSDAPEFKNKDEIFLVFPDSTETITEIDGSEIFQTVSGNRKCGILLNKFTKKDIPIGTEVFLKI